MQGVQEAEQQWSRRSTTVLNEAAKRMLVKWQYFLNYDPKPEEGRSRNPVHERLM